MFNTMINKAYIALAILFSGLFQISLPETPKIFFIDDYDYKTFYRIAKSRINKIHRFSAWKRAAPEVRTVTITSSLDSTAQKALFYNSGPNIKNHFFWHSTPGVRTIPSTIASHMESGQLKMTGYLFIRITGALLQTLNRHCRNTR